MAAQCTRTVFALPGVALDHLVSLLEAREGHLGNSVLFVSGLVGRDQGSIGGKREVDTGEARGTGQFANGGASRSY